MVLWFATYQPAHDSHKALAVNWVAVILIYALAKVFELADHAEYDFTSYLISGHSLKHIIASFATWPVISALQTQVIFNNKTYPSSASPAISRN